ncbi:glutamate 5-kinase [Acinetobacter dispersus]|uniref:glutamate 5-kinase n=1 Tax=Acinetobacter dispersus TaxID=70348 RepID=UPI001F4A70FC|nr:glutamate 5-kinase [Acinetobacter dispersus]MCH7394188.1 glutamate 5-kinase [Acinetobacter dispersus]
MGLRDELQADIAEALDEDLADAVQTFSCERIIKTEWDPLTENHIEVKESYSGRCVIGFYNQQEVVKSDVINILSTDKKGTLLQNETSKVPLIDDEWNTLQGKYRVMYVKADPANVTWVIQLRKV